MEELMQATLVFGSLAILSNDVNGIFLLDSVPDWVGALSIDVEKHYQEQFLLPLHPSLHPVMFIH